MNIVERIRRHEGDDQLELFPREKTGGNRRALTIAAIIVAVAIIVLFAL